MYKIEKGVKSKIIMKKQEKIKEILAKQDRQLEIDAIRIIENKEGIQNKEEAIKILKEYLQVVNKQNYPVSEEQEKQKKREYSESFRNALEQEKEKMEKIKKQEQEETEKEELRKQREKMKIRRAMQAYGNQEVTLQEYEIGKKGIIEKVKQILNQLEQTLNMEKKSLEVSRRAHYNFEQFLKADIEPKQVQIGEKVESKEERER